MNATIGTIIHGTMRPQDVVPAMLDALREFDAPEYQALTMPGAGFSTPPAHALEDDDAEWWDGEDCAYLMHEVLPDVLNNYAPAYTYFGCHPGDGSDLGFWPDFDQIDDDIRDGYLDRISDPGDHVKGRAAVFTNDHGNVTVYDADGGIVWDCV